MEAWVPWNGSNEDFDRVVSESEVLWQRDDSQPWEPCVTYLLLMPNGRVARAGMSSCSCWPDRGSSSIDEYPSLRDALGPLGMPVSDRNEAFHELCIQHGIEPTREG